MRGLFVLKNWNPHNIKDFITGETLGYVNDFTNFKLSLYKSLLKKFELLENTISIIIQGPLHERSISTIESYLKYGEVIVSCWEDDNLSLLDKYKEKITIIKNKYSDIKKYISTSHRQTRPYIFQNHTTRNGLAAANGFFSIKVRSDESFPVLDPLINILKNNRDSIDPKTGKSNYHKITTSNIYFRYDKENKFHPSDHIIAGHTFRLKQVFERSISFSNSKVLLNDISELEIIIILLLKKFANLIEFIKESFSSLFSICLILFFSFSLKNDKLYILSFNKYILSINSLFTLIFKAKSISFCLSKLSGK